MLKRTANIKRKIQVMKKTRMQMPINHFASKKLHICYKTHFTNNKISELSVSLAMFNLIFKT